MQLERDKYINIGLLGVEVDVFDSLLKKAKEAATTTGFNKFTKEERELIDTLLGKTIPDEKLDE